MPPCPAGEQLPLRLPSPEPNCLSLTHTAGSADLAPGMDSWCQAGQTDQLLIWCGQGEGQGRKEVQELRLLELEGALEPLTAERETQTREGGHCPRPHSTEETNTPHLSLCPGAVDSLVPDVSSSVSGLPGFLHWDPDLCSNTGCPVRKHELCHL